MTMVGIGAGEFDLNRLHQTLANHVADVPWTVEIGPTSIYLDTCEVTVFGFDNQCRRRVLASTLEIVPAAVEMAESLVPDWYLADVRQGACMEAFIRRIDRPPRPVRRCAICAGTGKMRGQNGWGSVTPCYVCRGGWR